jgi:hypothetical protein
MIIRLRDIIQANSIVILLMAFIFSMCYLTEKEIIGAKFYMFLVSFTLGMGMFISVSTKWRKIKRIGETPVSNISSAAYGLVQLRGRADFNGDPIISPLTGTPCVYHKTRIVEGYDVGMTESSRAFFLSDDTGRILIFPKDADMKLSRNSFEWEGKFHNTEYLIQRGDSLTILGVMLKGESINDQNFIAAKKGFPFQIIYSDYERGYLTKSVSDYIFIIIGGLVVLLSFGLVSQDTGTVIILEVLAMVALVVTYFVTGLTA